MSRPGASVDGFSHVHRPLLSLLTVGLLTAAGMVAPVGPAAANQPGDAGRFDTWTGYDVDRRPVAVALGDLNGDDAPDAAWARYDFFHGPTPGNTMVVQLNLGEGTLGEIVEYPAVDNSNDIAAGDLDGDADVDLVVVSDDSSLANTTIDLYRNDGTGAFVHSSTTGGSAPQRVILADLDGDGDRDLATTNGWGADFVSVLEGNGNGTFAAETRITVGEGQGGLAAADLDGDGDRDLAVGWSDPATTGGDVAVLTNDGAGGFTVADTLVVEDPLGGQSMSAPQVAAADLDGDGDQDLAVAGGGTSHHAILRNQGGLAFSQADVQAGFTSTNLHAVDFDDDGDVDVFSATMGSSFTGDVSLLRNGGGGVFAAEIIESSHQPVDVDTADFDGDGDLDLAVPNRGSGTAAVHPQGAGAAFEAPPTFPTFDAPNSVTTADLDADGDVDVAASVPVSNVIQVQLNDGSGALTAGSTIPSPTVTPSSVVAARLNADASPDLVWVASSFPNRFATALNNGDGTFGPVQLTTVTTCGIGQVTTADVDGDGDQDVLTGSGSFFCGGGADEMVSVTLGNGNGTFGTETLVDLGVALPTMVVGADLDGDGRTDLAAASATPCCGEGAGDVGVVLGQPAGGFGEPDTFVTGSGHREIAVADLDGDGDADLATTNNGGDGISTFAEESSSVLLNDGDGGFGTIDTFRGEAITGLLNEVAIDLGDLTGDGLADVAVANWTGKDVGVHVSLGGGAFDPTQIRYGMHSDLRDVELADMNGDGKLDIVGPTAASAQARPAGELAAAAATDGVSVLLNGGGGGGGTTTTLFPSSVTVESGTLVSGTAASLGADDDAYLVVRSTKAGTRTATWYGTFTGVSNGASSLSATYRGKASATCTQVISIFRWTTSTWVQLDSRAIGPTEIEVTGLSPAGTLGDFVSGSTGPGDVRLRLSCSSTATAFTTSGDLLRLVVGTAPATHTFLPSAFTVEAGSLQSGTVTSLHADDDAYLVVRSTKSAPRTATWYGTFAGVGNDASSLSATYRGKASAACTQVISIFRWTTSTWVQLDSRAIGTAEVEVAGLSPTGTVGDFVSGTSGPGDVRVRVSCSTSASTFTLSGDLLEVVVVT